MLSVPAEKGEEEMAMIEEYEGRKPKRRNMDVKEYEAKSKELHDKIKARQRITFDGKDYPIVDVYLETQGLRVDETSFVNDAGAGVWVVINYEGRKLAIAVRL